MRTNVLAIEDIESKMDKALEDNNFQVFYQPMLNIEKNLPDGSEALVRWYDPEKDVYMPPGLFMQVFEANRFIIKLDKYVYEQVCRKMREFKDNGGDSFRVSVNVSSITAMEKDFVSYYTSIKRKYNIADGLLTLEFPESFSSSDFKGFREIVNQLHAGGFRCCVDDFGSGNSSYHLLKEVPMDEIKLDRLFIKRGISEERDNKVFANVVAIARALGMKVTQKGVETQEEVTALKNLGCNTIQGYYYSKPLHISDFMEYVDRTRKNPFFM